MARQTASSAKSISYKGTATRRRITKQEWKAAGVEDQDTVEWNADNDYTVAASDLKADALKLLEKDSGFKLSGDEPPSEETPTS